MRNLSLLVTLVAFQASLAIAADEADRELTADTSNAEVNQRCETSDRGGVILDGRYIAPPYRVVAVAEGAEVNGHFVPEEGFNERSRRRRDDSARISFADRLLDRLDNGGWLLGWEEGEYGIIGESSISEILYLLSRDRSPNEKVNELEALDKPWIERAEWRILVERCELPPSVVETYSATFDLESFDPALAASIAAPRRYLKTSLYLLTVFGIGATVFALGTLLSYRPHEKMPWSHVNPSKHATQLVLRSVILLIGLAVLDLVCTTISARTASFWELNPLGAIALTSPLLLGSFKIGATLMSGSILLALRRYHGAQVASWWLALFCTVLAIRWVTYNSMFMT